MSLFGTCPRQNSALFEAEERGWRPGGTAAPVDTGDTILSDATDHALATIASILDHGETHREAEKPANETSDTSLAPLVPSEAMISPDGEGYSKLGPGPIAALRFRWIARRADNDEYFVDETIGENSTPLVAGPL